MPRPLPLNLPQTFLPERRLLAKLLSFIADQGGGDKEAISAATGIPTGKSTGKVEPMIRYVQGMGLANAEKAASQWRLSLTPLGEIVQREDPFLSEPVTIWLLHLMLCRRCGRSTPARGIADAWFALFADSGFRLGPCFTPAAWLDVLIERHGQKAYLFSLASIVLRSYLEASSLACAPVALSPLTVEGNPPGRFQDQGIIRQSAPVEKRFFPAYAAAFYLNWDELFNAETQLALDEFADQSRFFTVLGWDDIAISRWLDWMADQGILQIDRHTGTPILLRLRETVSIIARVYCELV
ncbi:MAG: hypothetical protein QG599_2729 [Pseudomonadota bacterium]|nr:hypothetical protein [Pseudomonadota bacterium]